MKSYEILFAGTGQTTVEEIDVPEPGPGEVLVQAAYSVISPGTERGRLINIRNEIKYPFRPGYSLAGRVIAVGAGVDAFRAGDPVAAWAPHAAHVTIPVNRAMRVPDGVDLESACFHRLGLVAVNGARRARIEIGESVAVVGQGLLGLLAMQMARLQGGVPVIALDLDDGRLAKSKAYGADLVANPKDEAGLKELMAGLPGGGPAAVIEVSGALTPVSLAVALVRRLGRVVMLGSLQRGGEVSPDLFQRVHNQGIEVIGAQTMARPAQESRPGNWTWRDDGRAFLELLQHGRLEVKSLITHRAPARQAPDLFEVLKSGDPALIGGVLDFTA